MYDLRSINKLSTYLMMRTKGRAIIPENPNWEWAELSNNTVVHMNGMCFINTEYTLGAYINRHDGLGINARGFACGTDQHHGSGMHWFTGICILLVTAALPWLSGCWALNPRGAGI